MQPTAPFLNARRSLLWLSIVGGGLLSACADATGPDDGIEIAISAPEHPAWTIERDYDENASLRCVVEFVAEARGKGTATWDGVTFVRYAGPDWSAPLDSVSYSTAEIGGIWERDSIRATWYDHSPWVFTGALPFKVTARFHYLPRPGGRRRSASATFVCGPEVSASAGALALDVIEIRTSDGVPEVGDTLFVRYSADSPALLLRTGVMIRGAWAAAQWFPEPLANARDRTVAFVIPRRAQLDSTVRIVLVANDGVGRAREVSVPTTVRVRDVSPPTLVSVWTIGGLRATNTIATFYVRANDAHDLHRIVWQVGGSAPFADSATIGDEEFDHTEAIGINVPPAWIGDSPPITFTVRDRVGLSSAPITVPAGTYEVYATVSGAVASGEYGMPGGVVGHVGDVVFDPKRNLLYTAHTMAGHLGILDLTTMVPRASIPIPGGAHSLDLTPGGDSLLIGQITNPDLPVVDLRTFALAAPIPLRVLDSIGSVDPEARPRPMGVRVMANGVAVVRTQVASSAGDNLLTVDLATGQVRVRADARPGAARIEPWWTRLELLPGRSGLVMFDPACARIYRAATDDFSACAAAPPVPVTGIAVRPDGQRFLVGARILGPDLSTLGEMAEAHFAILHPDGQHVLVTMDGTIQKLRLSDGRPVARLEVGTSGLDRMILLPDGVTILAFSSGAGIVYRVDASALMM